MLPWIRRWRRAGSGEQKHRWFKFCKERTLSVNMTQCLCSFLWIITSINLRLSEALPFLKYTVPLCFRCSLGSKTSFSIIEDDSLLPPSPFCSLGTDGICRTQIVSAVRPVLNFVCTSPDPHSRPARPWQNRREQGRSERRIL